MEDKLVLTEGKELIISEAISAKNSRRIGNPALYKGMPSLNPAGKPKGTLDKIHRHVKEHIIETFLHLQGIKGKSLKSWAVDNPGAFYQNIWIKAMPKDINLGGDLNLMIRDMSEEELGKRIRQLATVSAALFVVG